MYLTPHTNTIILLYGYYLYLPSTIPCTSPHPIITFFRSLLFFSSVMKKLLRKLSRVTPSAHRYSVLRSDPPARSSKPNSSRSDAAIVVPAGHFPVYVGLEENTTARFIVSAELLHHPVFVELLNISAQEYGYEQRGVLRIPVNVVVFERVLEALRVGTGQYSCLDDLDRAGACSFC